MSDQHFHFESGPIVKILAGLSMAAVIAFAIFAFVTGSGLAIALLIVLALAGGGGLILERVDSTRRREQGSEPTKDEHWGYHGRPGS
ncbi:MAG: hypothetical protein ACLFRT_07360 [Actinomycetota bacterium]